MNETTTGVTRAAIIGHALDTYEERSGLWRAAATDPETADCEAFPLPPVAVIHQAIAGAVSQRKNKRGGYGWLASAPTFRERPLSSLFLRLYRWHGGNGQLDGYMMARWDAGALQEWARRYAGEGEPLAPGPVREALDGYGPEVRKWLASDVDVFDQLDSACLILRGGSPAAEAWGRVLRSGR